MASDDQMDLFNLAGMAPAADSAPAANFNPDLIPTDVKVPIPSGIYRSMEQISEHCNRCHRCELGKNRTHAVVGRGNDKAPILIVGEGPGQTEDETGLAFVGKAGQLLDKILASVQITEDDYFVSNIVKCRPPDNRTPTVQEMDACRPYLMEQIRMIDPKIILLLGAASVRGITGDKRGITKIRGQWIEWDNRLCMPMLHPAYLLRNPSRDKGSPKWLTWQDIQTVRSKLDEIRQEMS
ncbi:uracil-DNA glycosylase [Leptolyngbya sp. FACHB-711]|uniref:uracil-DNA glycosylase n=1 Tax=unclassified Leptolyngbya TaxID=2650499 RepID=UPI001685FF0F|nr:uracil-DNA glycosylase [Leptolyngbya sp. FACHB-711]MBD1853849.1 uracil-DNA glycosylase [Cyanobacteria bacterium FACHB-502]MBD2026196.1 uracil-DNA glycosylase [Leptolyngbya sp. FACHB-711]